MNSRITRKIIQYLLIALSLNLFSGFGVAPQAQAAEVFTSTVGFKFAVTTPPGYTSWTWTLYMSSDETGTASVDFPTGTDSPTVQIRPGVTSAIVVPSQDLMDNTSSGLIRNKVIRVSSTVPISLYGCSRQSATSDCTNFMPITAWGTEYRTLSYPTTISGLGDRVTVLTGDDTATITMKFKSAVTTPAGSYTAGQETTTTLLPNQVWSLEATSVGQGFTGSLITSSSSIGVLAGADCINGFGGACDTNVEMVPPIRSWGKNFYLNNYRNSAASGGSGVRILASQDTTTVTITGDETVTTTLNAGEIFSELMFDIAGTDRNLSIAISADKPVLLGHYMRSGTYYVSGDSGTSDTGDPALSYMPPFEQFLSSYTVVNANGFKAQYINVLIPTSAISSLRLDNAAVATSKFRRVASTSWSSAQLQVSTGSHTLRADQPFGIEIYGADSADSYAYVGGANYSALSTVAALRLSANSQSATVGQQVCVPVTVLDSSDAPVLGVRVDGTVSGANATLYPSANTNSSGVADVCYTGTVAGTDTLSLTANGYSTSATVTWTLNAPSISYSPNYLSLATSVAMPTLTPTNTGGTISSYSVSGTLPSGVSLNTSTGVISGTPSSNTARETVTVTATNSAGTSSATVSIEVVPAVQPTISYPQSSYSFTLDSAISTLIPITTGTFPTWSVSPSLPRGLSIDSQSGRITGTPTRVTSAATYTVTATNSAGSSTTNLQLTVAENPPDVSFNVSTYSFVVNSAITVITPINNGSPASSWTISPSLPAGLAFSTLNGQISGTPTSTSTSTTYTVTGTNSAGSDSATVSIAIEATLAAPNISYSPTSISGTVNVAITSLSPTNSGGAVASWSISPSVPTGLSFSTSTGIISGTPTTTSASSSYTVTATNATGSSNFNVTIAVSAASPSAPSISYSPASISGTVNSAIATLTPSNAGGAATSWTVSPAVPSGVSFSTSTGVFSGTPTVVSSSATYTITATNSSGSGTTTISISVSGATSSGSSDATQTITFTYTIEEAIPGTNTQIYASSSIGAGVSISVSANSEVCEMRNGRVFFIKRGVCEVTASAGRTTIGSTTYGSATASMSIQVRSRVYVIPLSLDDEDRPKVSVSSGILTITPGRYRLSDSSTATIRYLSETIVINGVAAVTLVYNPDSLFIPSYVTPWQSSTVSPIESLSSLRYVLPEKAGDQEVFVIEYVVSRESSAGNQSLTVRR